MPPKAKFSKEQVVQASLDIVESEGMQALTARRLGEKMGSSARPIFTTFKNMDEVVELTISQAWKIFDSYIKEGLKENPPFRGSGRAYIRFATERPKLFQLLFMKEEKSAPDVDVVLMRYDGFDKVLQSIVHVYHVNKSDAENLYRHLWIYSHGIAVLIATNVCRFSEEQITKMLSEIFQGLISQLKKK